MLEQSVLFLNFIINDINVFVVTQGTPSHDGSVGCVLLRYLTIRIHGIKRYGVGMVSFNPFDLLTHRNFS